MTASRIPIGNETPARGDTETNDCPDEGKRCSSACGPAVNSSARRPKCAIIPSCVQRPIAYA